MSVLEPGYWVEEIKVDFQKLPTEESVALQLADELNKQIQEEHHKKLFDDLCEAAVKIKQDQGMPNYIVMKPEISETMMYHLYNANLRPGCQLDFQFAWKEVNDILGLEEQM